VLGGDFLSRLNTDLREEKSWTYGVQSIVREPVGQRSLLVVARCRPTARAIRFRPCWPT
jgi:predicted Zn-dependent peptidase